ncbi:sulfite exporter TauE/SafE family protein [Jannaschia sp. 2305UL9-9]|uniref:sulfite exporter TauE/SafE family protein n=1 Tax=Jannaschia sp. 2305UL9-9 TaxID=3121638 RepID=UPI00352857E7
MIQIAALIAGLIATAIFAGILAGLLGVGGGIVLVPVLFWLLSLTQFPSELSMHMAVATSLATIVFTSLSSARSHRKRGSLDKGLLRLWAPGIVLGALCGGVVAKFVNADVLRGIFGGIALIVAANMAWKTTLVWRDRLPESRVVNGIIAWATGLLSALMGIGGGTLGVPTLVGFGVDIRRAVGTAAAFGVLIAVPAVLGFVWAGWSVPDRPWGSLGYVNLPAALLILPFTVAFAPVGAALSHRISTEWVKRSFAIFLGLTAIRMLIGVFG